MTKGTLFIKKHKKKRFGKSRHHIDWRLCFLVFLCFCLVALPFLALFALSFGGFDSELWQHLHKTILWPTVFETLLLMVSVGILVTVFGVSTAWLVATCSFPARSIFVFALLLPLALPTYISAFAYIEFLGFTGPLQSFIRDVFGFKTLREYWFPDYRTIYGAAFVMSVVLYPYVYLTSRASFSMQTASVFDASRTLGSSPVKLFFKVALPMARPAIIIGVALSLMETVNDIGAVEFFGVKTLTTLVYDVWFNRSSLGTASQLAVSFLILIVFLLWFERHARRKSRLYQKGGKIENLRPFQLKGLKAWCAFLWCLFPVLLGFVIPVSVLAESAFHTVFFEGVASLKSPILNSLLLSGLAMVSAVSIGLFFAYLTHMMPNPITSFMVRLASLGYAIPGVVLAVGILMPLATFDNWFDDLMRANFDIKTGLIFSGTVFALVYAYTIRFLPMAYGACDTGFERLSPNYGFAARTLGRTEWATLRAIYLPLLRPSVMTGALLVFVDCMKELPATLLLRPFNYETLATRVYDSASLEIFEDGALPALAIIVTGLLPVLLLVRQNKA